MARRPLDIPLTEATETSYFYKVFKSLLSCSCRSLKPVPFQVSFAHELMIGPTFFFSATSLLLLYYRIFSPDDRFRYQLYWAFALIAATMLSSIPMFLALCLPDDYGSYADATAKCSKTSMYAVIQGPLNLVFDIFLIYLHASVVLPLQLPLRHKIGVLAIFSTGIL